jgi:hypothetical protein
MAKDWRLDRRERWGVHMSNRILQKGQCTHLIPVSARHVQDPCSVLVCEGQVEGDNALLCVEIHPKRLMQGVRAFLEEEMNGRICYAPDRNRHWLHKRVVPLVFV